MTQTKEPVVPVPATDMTASPRQPLGRSFYNPLGHALELQRGLEDALATRVERADFGAAIFRDELRRVASLNLLRVEGPRPNVAAADLMAEADRLQAGLRSGPPRPPPAGRAVSSSSRSAGTRSGRRRPTAASGSTRSATCTASSAPGATRTRFRCRSDAAV